jgi:exosortase A-associated hydrolase 2
MKETPFFFDRPGAQLFGLLHQPAAADRVPFVFCHPFGEEKLWAHRTFVSFARALAHRGHCVLRFDYLGNGESSGSFSQSSIATALDDIACAIELIKRRTGATHIGLLGLRLGASLALKAAASRSDVKALVLWSPILDGAHYLQDLLRINVTTQLAVYREVKRDREALTAVLEAGDTVNVDGYEIGPEMARQLGALAIADEPALPTARCLIAHIDRNPAARPPRELEALCARLADSQTSVVQEDQFWKEILRFYYEAPNLFAVTERWLEELPE